MRPRELLRRSLARADVRTAWIIGAALLVAVSVPAVLLYAYAATESLEEADRWFDFVLQVAVREVDEHGVGASEFDDIQGRLPNPDAYLRLRAPNGDVLYERGIRPDPEQETRALVHRGRTDPRERRDFGSMFLLHSASWIVGERVADSGIRVELALPLRHYASESSEIGRRAIVAAVISAAAVLLIALGTAARAFSPLRRATAMLREVDTGSLGVRLPSRGTADPIDRHAETLNGLLERIDTGFARLRAFSSDAAHELRTPLNRISNVTEVALLKGEEPDLRAAL